MSTPYNPNQLTTWHIDPVHSTASSRSASDDLECEGRIHFHQGQLALDSSDVAKSNLEVTVDQQH